MENKDKEETKTPLLKEVTEPGKSATFKKLKEQMPNITLTGEEKEKCLDIDKMEDAEQ